MSPLRLLPILALAAAASLAGARAGAQTLEVVDLTAEEEVSGWFLNVSLEGSTNIASASVTPPGGPAIDLACLNLGDLVECDFEDPGFTSLAELLASYPAGTWDLELNGGDRTASLDFSPVEPDGDASVSDPADNATNVSPTPTIVYSQDCTNCLLLLFEIDVAGGQGDISLEGLIFAPIPASGSVPYADLESADGPKPAELPEGEYRLTNSIAAGSITMESLTPGGDDFEYGTGAVRNVETSFTVPEPSAAALGVVLAVALARRRSSREGRSAPG